MGNICCQTQTDVDPFTDIMPHYKDYQSVEWPEDDPQMSKWKTKLSHDNQPEQLEGQSPKLMKHKEQERYFVGSWDTNGNPTGIGQIYQPKRMFFDGKFQKGFPQGAGKLQFLDRKCQYEGNFKAGKANGEGTFNDFNSRYTIDAKWVQSKPDSGKITFMNDQNMLNVQFSDYNSQKATILYRDGRKYQGGINWQKIVPNGHGVVQFPQNHAKNLRYEGQWRMGQMHGKGKMQWKDGSSYEGDYQHGKKHGFGRFVFPSKSCYQGSWENGKQQGAGRIFNSSGQQQKIGLFELGKFVMPMTPQQFNDQIKKDSNKYNNQAQQVQEKVQNKLGQIEQNKQEENQSNNEKEQNKQINENQTKSPKNLNQSHKIPSIIKQQEIESSAKIQGSNIKNQSGVNNKKQGQQQQPKQQPSPPRNF